LPFIERDLHFNAGPVDDAEPFPDEYAQLQLVTTDFGQPIDPDADEFALNENQASGYLGIPEPPPFALILSGLVSLGFFALGRRVRWKRRQLRRRTVVRMRTITAER
jgi:hypothetical protein